MHVEVVRLFRAKLLGVAQGTVRSWMRSGLPVVGAGRPRLIHGADLKTWLKDRQLARRCICQPWEMYCLRCRAPRTPAQGSMIVDRRSGKTAILKAQCSACGPLMNRATRSDDAFSIVGQARSSGLG